MGRCGVALVLVFGLGATAMASPVEATCRCGKPAVLAPRAGGIVPRNAKLWAIGQTNQAFTIDGIDASLLGEWTPAFGATVYTPTELRPGTYPILFDHLAGGKITVVDEIDHTPPARPEVWGGAVEVNGRDDVTRLEVAGRFDPDTALVRITLAVPGRQPQIAITTPDQLVLCQERIEATPGTLVLVTVEGIDLAGNVSAPTAIEIAPIPGFDDPCMAHYRCGLGPMISFVAGAFLVLIVLIVTAIAVFRRIQRGTTGEPPILVPNLVATELARHARARDAAYLVVAIALVAAAWSRFGECASVGGIWALLRLGDYAIAARAISLLQHGTAIAELYGTNLVVRHAGKQSAVLLSRGEIEQAQRAALPSAKLT